MDIPFVKYINFENCPELYEIVINIILTQGDKVSDEEMFLINNVFTKYEINFDNLAEILSSSICFLEYLKNIENGNFVNYIIEKGKSSKNKKFKKFVDKVKNSRQYYSKLFFEQFKCETLYIFNEIVPIEETSEKVLLGNELINSTTRECFTCGKNLRTDLLFYMLYNGILKETIMEIFSSSIAKKMCCKRSIFNNIDLILEPYLNPSPLTRKYVIDDDIKEKIIKTSVQMQGNVQQQGVPDIGNLNTEESILDM